MARVSRQGGITPFSQSQLAIWQFDRRCQVNPSRTFWNQARNPAHTNTARAKPEHAAIINNFMTHVVMN